MVELAVGVIDTNLSAHVGLAGGVRSGAYAGLVELWAAQKLTGSPFGDLDHVGALRLAASVRVGDVAWTPWLGLPLGATYSHWNYWSLGLAAQASW